MKTLVLSYNPVTIDVIDPETGDLVYGEEYENEHTMVFTGSVGRSVYDAISSYNQLQDVIDLDKIDHAYIYLGASYIGAVEHIVIELLGRGKKVSLVSCSCFFERKERLMSYAVEYLPCECNGGISMGILIRSLIKGKSVNV